MKILIQDLVVIFPYTLVFNEQIEYMTYLKRALDSQGHALLEMPTGTGKTICLLSLLTSYLSNRTKYKKIIYCTRTVVEMEKTLKEIKNLLKKRYEEDKNEKRLLVVGLTAKRNLCIHKNVQQWRINNRVDVECKKRTAQWVRKKNKDLEMFQEQTLCEFYESFRQSTQTLAAGDQSVYSIDDLKQYGAQKIKCPYYVARDGVSKADIVVFNYLYLLDPKISPNFIKELAKDTIVVFDEAHNIDDVCIEAYTVKLNKNILSGAQKNIVTLRNQIQTIKTTSEQKYNEQYAALMKSLKGKTTQGENSSQQITKQIPLVPQSILRTGDYLDSLQQVVIFFKNKLKERLIIFHDNPKFLYQITTMCDLEQEFFKLANQKLKFILTYLQITQTDLYSPLNTMTLMTEMIAKYSKGFKVIYQPNPMDGGIADPMITLACLDCSIAMQVVFKSFPCVVLTSGTISPIETYPNLLGFKPVILKSIDIQLVRNSIRPLIIGTTMDQSPLTSEYKQRSNKSVTRNFAQLLINLSDIVPDGILCFFPSYMYMQHVIKQWHQSKLIEKILERKYVFIEKKQPLESLRNLTKYKQACDNGRGAIFLAIARGKIAEGVDFQQHYGRCVIMMGFPVQNSNDPILLERVKYMIQNKQIKDKNQFFQFDTMRQCAQCLGRVMRKKTDYGLMIFADERFKKSGKYNKLPNWIKKCLQTSNINITMEYAFFIASQFFREMGKSITMGEKFFKREQYFKVKIAEFQEKKK